MQIDLVRYCYGPECVLGLLKFGEHSLWTVERPWKNNAVFVSCIPDGTYPMIGFDSPTHPNTFVITPVPGRTGILIHAGNTVKDVSGCIAPGIEYDGMIVRNSREAMRLLNYVLDRKEQHTITLGPGMGAQLMQPASPDTLPSGSDEGNGNGGVQETRQIDSPGGTNGVD